MSNKRQLDTQRLNDEKNGDFISSNVKFWVLLLKEKVKSLRNLAGQCLKQCFSIRFQLARNWKEKIH